MANTLGAFKHLGADGLPIRVLDGLQDTGRFNHVDETGLPIEFLLTESHEVLGSSGLALAASGQLTLTAVEPVNLPLVLSTAGQVGPHAQPAPLAVQTFGDLTFAEARGHIALTLNQAVPASLTPVAAHAASLPLVLATSADTGIRGNADLALAASASGALRADAPIALAATGTLSFAANATGTSPLALSSSGVLTKAPSADAPLVLATAGQLQVASNQATSQIALSMAGFLQAGVRGSAALVLATAGTIPRDAVGASGLAILVAGVLEPANHNVTGDAALALKLFGGGTLATSAVFAKLRELSTLHPSIPGVPGGTSYE